jgi:diguanylate cyclase (GGDEF)-like protein/PAS domain S-box-containing protein
LWETSPAVGYVGKKEDVPLKLPLERYVQFGFGVSGLTIILMCAVQFNARNALRVTGEWIDHTTAVIQEVTAIRGLVTAGESAARGFALTGDSVYLEAVKVSVASANRHERELRSLTTDNPSQQRRLDKLEPLLSHRFQLLDQLAAERRLSGVDAAAQFARTGAGSAAGAAVELLGQEIQNQEHALLNVRRAALERSTAHAEIVSVSASAFSLLLLCAASALIRFDSRRRGKLETDLRHEKHLFTTLMDTVPDCVYFKDTKSRFLRINAAMGRRLGVSDLAEAIGKSDADYYAPTQAGRTRADEEKVLQTGRALMDREELESSSGGREVWVVSSKLPIVESDGSIDGLFGISRDITASKQAEEALESANSKLTGSVNRLEQRNRESMVLGEMGELLQTCVNEEEAERILRKFARDLCPALSGALSMIKASRNAVERTVTWGDVAALRTVFSPEDCWALRRGRPHGSGSSNGRIRCAHIDQAFTGSFVCVPLIAHGETLGVLHFLRLDGQEIDGSELRLATMVGERMGLAIANLRLREELQAQSIRDPLTSLFNRRYVEESFERELSRADRDGSTIGTIMLDIDRFKQFNDTFGHDGGDAILKEFSAVLLAQTRKEDIVCRYGGEEFLVILPGATLEDSRSRAEKMLEGIRKIAVITRGRELGHISASLGVAIYPNHGNTMGSLIRAADGAMYQAKTYGRDCVVLAAAPVVDRKER